MRALLLIVMLCLPGPLLAGKAVVQALDATLVLYSDDGRERFLGSAFVYGRATQVVTNEHVVGRAQSVIAVARDGRRYRARVIAVDVLRDLARLELDSPHDQVLTPASALPEVGAPVFAAGAPLEAAFTLTAGIVSAQERQIDPAQPVRYVQHSAPVNPGSSGGPLLDAAGRVLGINTRIADGSRFFAGIAYAVPVGLIDAFLARGPGASHPDPGFVVRPLSAPIRAALGVEGPGVLVDHVTAGSAAARAGLRAGDILRSIGATAIGTPGDIAFALEAMEGGTTLVILRQGDRVELTMTPGAAPRPLAAVARGGTARRDSYTLADMGITANATGEIIRMSGQGAGFFAGLSEGDVILAIDGQPVKTLADGWAGELRVTKPLLLLVQLSDGSTRHYLLDPWDSGPAFRPSSGANVMDQEVVNFD